MSETQSDERLIEFALWVGTADNTNSLWQRFTALVKSYGAELISYHHIPPSVAPDRAEFTIYTEGFDPLWVARYREMDYRRIDPIAQRASHALSPFRWSEVEKSQRLTTEQRDYITDMRRWITGDGVGIPAYGPSSRNGYFGVGSQKGAPEWSPIDALRVYGACHLFHLNYCILRIRGLGQDFDLTPVETSILRGLQKGRSTAMIAATLSRRPDTIKAALSLIQKKMGVTDSGSAILRAVSCGLIDPL